MSGIKTIRSVLASFILAMLCAPVMADPISVSQSQPITSSGQNFNFVFAGLDASDGSGGMFSFFARGDYTDPVNETATITLDLLGGSLVMSEVGIITNTIAGLSLFANNTISSPSGGTDQILDMVFNLSGSLLDTLLADSSIAIGVSNSGPVSFVNNSSHLVRVGLSYESATAVPEPTSLALLGLGLAGIGFARRRKKI